VNRIAFAGGGGGIATVKLIASSLAFLFLSSSVRSYAFGDSVHQIHSGSVLYGLLIGSLLL
jgi:hypothetical protein